MPRQKIHKTLTTLHEQLQDTSRLDANDRSMLKAVLHDIQQVLDADEPHDTVSDRVMEAVAGFEVSHPKVATALHEIVESLRKL